MLFVCTLQVPFGCKFKKIGSCLCNGFGIFSVLLVLFWLWVYDGGFHVGTKVCLWPGVLPSKHA